MNTDEIEHGTDEWFAMGNEDRIAWAARQRAKRAELAAMEAQRDGLAMTATFNRLIAKCEDENKRRSVLPCYPAHVERNYTAAVDAAAATDACRTCADAPDVGPRINCPRHAEADEKERIERRMASAGVPAWIAAPVLAAIPRRIRLDAPKPLNLQTTDALSLARGFMGGGVVSYDSGQSATFRGDEWIMALGGNVGVGKSVAAAWAISQHGGYWVSAPTLARPDDEIMRRLCDAAFAVIDDLGEEYAGPSGYAQARIAEALAYRHAHRSRTIITLNLNRADFATRYGVRVNDRLSEGGRWFGLVGASMRGGA